MPTVKEHKPDRTNPDVLSGIQKLGEVRNAECELIEEMDMECAEEGCRSSSNKAVQISTHASKTKEAKVRKYGVHPDRGIQQLLLHFTVREWGTKCDDQALQLGHL